MPPLPYIDLHTHSTCSDGTLSPGTLLDLAARRRLTAIALTDHDTVAGLDEAISRGLETGVDVMPGIEISSHLDQSSIHILGYGFDYRHPELLRFIDELQQNRHNRNQGILTRLQAIGIEISADELQQPGGNQAGRPHFARLLVQKGIVKTSQEAFTRYLKRGGLAFVEHLKPPSDQAIRRIIAAGGLAFLAHPACSNPGLEKIPSLVAALCGQGLSGIELYYPTHSGKVRRYLRKIAADHRLLLSGGTDFHGDGNSSVPLGGNAKTLRVPSDLLQKIKERLPTHQ